MAYRIEGSDIVISGWEQGIAESPYSGIGDMRNIDISSIPGEISVTFANQAVSLPPVFNAVAFSADATTDTFTVASTTGLYNGCAITFNTIGTTVGISTGVVYYVTNITSTTFQVTSFLNTTAAINITTSGSGTWTTYQFGNQRGTGLENDRKMSYVSYVGSSAGSAFSGRTGVYIVDYSNYLWLLAGTNFGVITINTLYFCGNIGGVAATSTVQASVAIWKNYIILYGGSAGIFDAWNGTMSTAPASVWKYGFTSVSSALDVNSVLVSKDDGNFYFTNSNSNVYNIGSLIEQPTKTFDPNDSTTYAVSQQALVLPNLEYPTALCELGSDMYIGTQSANVYVWDKISLGFNQILTMSESNTRAMVGTNQNVFVFAGSQGYIYYSNGASIEKFARVSKYVTGNQKAYIQFIDASYSRGKINFTLYATDNNGNNLDTTSGVWSIDMDTKAVICQNKLTTSGYGKYTKAVPVFPLRFTTSTSTLGNGVVSVWYDSSNTTYGLDRPTSTPYIAGESYIETDIIPIGTYFKPFTGSQIEWKTSQPLVTGESISLYGRSTITGAYTLLGTTNGDNTSISDAYKFSIEKMQWLQIKVVMSSTATNPSFCRLTELRLRLFPSQE